MRGEGEETLTVATTAEAPDLIREVVGWRGWKVSVAGDLLSANAPHPWRPGENRAHCLASRGHRAPDPACTCGFYGLYHPAQTRRMGSVHGLFVAWGRIVASTRGFRAERARVLCLVRPKLLDPYVLDELVKYHDVPLLPNEEAALAYAQREGYELIPEELRPRPPQTVPAVGVTPASASSAVTYEQYAQAMRQTMRAFGSGLGPAPRPRPKRVSTWGWRGMRGLIAAEILVPAGAVIALLLGGGF